MDLLPGHARYFDGEGKIVIQDIDSYEDTRQTMATHLPQGTDLEIPIAALQQAVFVPGEEAR